MIPIVRLITRALEEGLEAGIERMPSGHDPEMCQVPNCKECRGLR